MCFGLEAISLAVPVPKTAVCDSLCWWKLCGHQGTSVDRC